MLVFRSSDLPVKIWVRVSDSLFAFDPDVRFARLVAGLYVDDARAAADGAVFGVGLRFAAS
jgi:hypothetical protein